MSFLEGAPNWHGKALKGRRAGARDQRARSADGARSATGSPSRFLEPAGTPPEERVGNGRRRRATSSASSIATREAYGAALARLGAADPRVVALDADVKNSTFSEKFEAAAPRSLLSVLHRRAGDDRRGDGPGGARRHSVSVDVCRVSSRARPTSSACWRSATSTSRWPGRMPACRSARTARRRWRSKISSMMTAQPNITVLYPSDAVCAEQLVVAARLSRRARSTSGRRARRCR